MGARSYGYGSVTVAPGVVLEPGDPLHPDNRRSESLVRAVIDADGVARRLVPWGMDGMAKHLDEPFAEDIREAVRALAGQQLDGFFEYEEDDGAPPVSWRAWPVPEQGGYVVRISRTPEEADDIPATDDGAAAQLIRDALNALAERGYVLTQGTLTLTDTRGTRDRAVARLIDQGNEWTAEPLPGGATPSTSNGED